MKVTFGKECIGCGACVDACPEVFEFDPDLFEAKLNRAADFARYSAQIQNAADICPVHNIEIEK